MRLALAGQQRLLRTRVALLGDPEPAETTERAASLIAVTVAACSRLRESDWAGVKRGGLTQVDGSAPEELRKASRSDAAQSGRHSPSRRRVGCALEEEEAG